MIESGPEGETADKLTAAYEDLRRSMMGEPSQTWGLVVFIRQGMRAWMDAYGQSHAAANPQRAAASMTTGEGIHADRLRLAHLLTDMAQACFVQGGI
jgi:hypothetical protein